MGGVEGPWFRKTLGCSKYEGASQCVNINHGSLPLGGRPSSSVLATSTSTWHFHSLVSCTTFVARGRPPPPLPSMEKKLRGWFPFPPIGQRWGRPPVRLGSIEPDVHGIERERKEDRKGGGWRGGDIDTWRWPRWERTSAWRRRWRRWRHVEGAWDGCMGRGGV